MSIRPGLAALILGALTQPALAAQDKPDILLLVWDATRPDHLSPYGYERDTTPNLAKLAAGGTVFDVAVSAAPWTMPSVAAIFTGLFPHNHGVDYEAEGFSLSLPDATVTIAEMLKAEGYKTAIWTDQHIYYKQDGFLAGFDHKVSGRDMRPARFVSEALEFRDEAGDTPVFEVIYFLDPHAPYEPPAAHNLWYDEAGPKVNIRGCGNTGAREFPEGSVGHCDVNNNKITLTAAQWQQLENQYDGELHMNDARLGELMDGLTSRGALDDTAIFFTADHGEGFNDHPREKTWHRLPYESIIRVPLIARLPGTFKPGHVSAAVRTIDIHPSIAQVAGVTTPPPVNGASLVGLSKAGKGENRPSIGTSHFAGAPIYFRGPRFKLLMNRKGPEMLEMYDLQTDPLELTNLAASKPAVVTALRAKLASFIEETKLDLGVGAEAADDDMELLKSLGYAEE